MPALSDYTAGTITLTNGSVNFTGAGTGWQAADFREGDTILGIEDNAGVEYVIASITGNGAGTLTQEWGGATGTYTYRMRYLADGARVTAQARNLIELLGNGNLQALAGLTGPGVPVFNGPHSMTVKPEADFVNGVAYNVQVDTLPDRAAYDGQSAGFAVLVSDIGDGRSALFSKASNTSGDWTDPAYITGPAGPYPEVEATVDTLPPGSTATVTPTPITGGVRLDFELPGASGFYNAGVYDIAEAYNQDDVVRHNGSSFIALQAVPAGTSPSSAFPPVDTAYWQVLASRGSDGAGTGDVVGPSGAVADRIAVFDGTTGKIIKDGGVTVSELVPADGSITNAKLANMATARIKGRVTAGTGVPEDLTAAQVWSLLGVAPVANIPDTLTADKAFRRGNVIGLVSQSSGTPTGALVERSSNANGEYVRFADGTQICTLRRSENVAIGGAYQGGFSSSAVVWTFPAAFVSAPAAMGSGDLSFGVIGYASSATSYSYYYTAVTSVAANPRNIGLIAIGRWF